MTKFLASAGILVIAATVAWLYLGRGRSDRSHASLFGDRPWRRVGAAICLLIAVMFVIGIYVVDIPERPIPYALYWLIILGLVVWLCVLAVRDFLYTRRVIRRRRAGLDLSTALPKSDDARRHDEASYP